MSGVLQSVGVRGLMAWLAVMATLNSKSSQLASHRAEHSLSAALSAGGGSQCENGDIRVRGVETESLVAGRLEFCHEKEWKAVCDNGWSGGDATTVCRQLEFSLGEWKSLSPHSMAMALGL